MIEGEDDEVGPEDKDASPAEGPEPVEPSESDGTEWGGFRMPAGFSRSLLPNMDDYLAIVIAPLQERMRSLMPDYSAIVCDAFAPVNERLREQMASIVASVPAFSMSPLDLPALHAPVINPATQEMLKRISEQQATAMEGLRKSFRPLFDPEALRGLNRALLPPNLKDYADEIRASQVHEFVEQEGIPLYLVPRGTTALWLLRAKDRAGRRRVLGDCYETLREDCAAVLERADHEAVSDELGFALDGFSYGMTPAKHCRSRRSTDPSVSLEEEGKGRLISPDDGRRLGLCSLLAR